MGNQESIQDSQLIAEYKNREVEAEKIVQIPGDAQFKEGEYLQAIAIYKKHIQDCYSVKFAIQGLGNFDMETYNFEWWAYKWYDDQRKSGKLKGNIFDALSLCYCRLRQSNPEQIQKGIMWYEDMLSQNETYELYMGYANIFYNKGLYDHALKAYNKVIELRPSLVNAYICIMFLYEYRRVDKKQAIKFAKIILEKDPNNMYANFVLGRNQTDIDQKINKLQEGAQKFPKYIRLVNEVGLSYGSKKEHKKAIYWYKKCVDLAPNHFAPAYNNIGFRTQLLQEELNKTQSALSYYLQAISIDAKYRLAFTNSIKIFQKLKLTDEDIINKMSEHLKIDKFSFYYSLGQCYYDKGKQHVDKAILWYQKAEAINSESFNLYNSMGAAYESQQIQEQTQKCYQEQAEKCYLKSIELNEQCIMSYYKLGLIYKKKKEQDKAIEWYMKAIKIDPKYYPAYNSLANIYRERQDYQKAIGHYKKCLGLNPTYTLAYCNIGICLLKQEMYQDAFDAFAHAKQLLPTDNNNLSQVDKTFLKQNLTRLDLQDQKWQVTGSIRQDQKQQMLVLIKSFQSHFKILYPEEVAFKTSDEVVLDPTLLEIIRIIHRDKFQMKEDIVQIYTLMKKAFQINLEYFQIIPQIFIQFFYNNSIFKSKPILDVQSRLFSITQLLYQKQGGQLRLGIEQCQGSSISYNCNLKYFIPPKECQIKLFKNMTQFKDYESLCEEIIKLNKSHERHLPEFKQLVNMITKRTGGVLDHVRTKMPKRKNHQFIFIIQIISQILKQEIKQKRDQFIISSVGKLIKATGGNITLVNIVREIESVLKSVITLILQERKKNKIQTTCNISDLLRGKVAYKSEIDIQKAVEVCDRLCHLRGYEILSLDNRLSNPRKKDVLLKIQVGEVVCQLQLAMQQDQSMYNFLNSIQEIKQSPLGCILGSYLFMSKGFNYPLIEHCKDIVARLKDSTDGTTKINVQAANFIIETLDQD